MSRDYKKFFRMIAIITVPYALILATYLRLDPFMVLYKYDHYYARKGPERNVEFVGVETFKMNKDKYRFDSFILGNSRSQAYKTKNWAKYIDGVPFHFSASGETLFGIYSKVKYLDESQVALKNVIIVIDQIALAKTSDSKGVILIKHPEVSKKSPISFHIEFVKGYIQDFFFVKYIYYRLTGKDFPFAESVVDKKTKLHDDVTNDLYYKWCDDAIAKDSVQYYVKNKEIFYKRDSSIRYSEKRITPIAMQMLKEMNAIFAKHHTDFKVIINPLYEQIYINKEDLADLSAVFGAERIYDYSGINKFTQYVHNYYESSHYRPVVANQIMEEIYVTPKHSRKSAQNAANNSIVVE